MPAADRLTLLSPVPYLVGFCEREVVGVSDVVCKFVCEALECIAAKN